MGFIGLHTVRALLSAGESVVVSYHSSYRVPEFWKDEVGKRVIVEQLDVTSAHDVIGVAHKHKVTGIVHLAMPGPAGLSAAEDFRTSMYGLINVMEAARLMGVKRLTFASSSTLYQGLADGPYREDLPLPLESANQTAAYKKACEVLLHHYADRTGLDVGAVRMRAVYGPMYYSMMNMPSRFAHAAVKGVEPNYGPAGAPFEGDDNDYSNVHDVAAIFQRVAMADKLPYRVYNISQGKPSTFKQLADAVRAVEPNFKVQLKTGVNPKGNPPNNYLTVDRVKEVFGYTPQFGVEKGMADYIGWLRNHLL
jgi:UDP-glucose 4-epimerase